MKEKEEIYLRHILDAINNIEKYTKNLDFSEFEKNSMTYHAVIYEILVIGEAVKNLSGEQKMIMRAYPGKILLALEIDSYMAILKSN